MDLVSKWVNNFTKSDWADGRVYKGDDWLAQYQGKNLDRRVNRNNIFLSLYRYITNLPRGVKHIWRKLFSRHR